MKKTLALVLAGVMAAGMTTTAFAALKNKEVRFDYNRDSNFIIVDRDDDNRFDTYDWDEDGKEVKDKTYNSDDGNFDRFAREDGGKKVALPVYDENGAPLTDEETLRGWRINDDWSVGDLDEKPDFEYVRVNGEYQWAVTFILPEAEELKTADLAGSVTIYKSSTDNRNPVERVNKLVFGVEYGYGTLTFAQAEDDLANAEIVTFGDEEGEIVMDFGDYLTFEVDVTGQGKLNLKNDQDFDPEFAAYYDYANIDFINFEYEPSFNKIGRVYIYAPEDAFIYKKGAEGAEAISGLEWDEDYEAWTFKTRKLESYVISDVELDEKTVTDDNSSTTDDGKVNPDTGR